MREFYEVLIIPAAADYLRSIREAERPVVKWLLDSLELMSSDFNSGDVSEIDAEQGMYRINIGDHKLLFLVQQQEMRLIVLTIERRRGR